MSILNYFSHEKRQQGEFLPSPSDFSSDLSSFMRAANQQVRSASSEPPTTKRRKVGERHNYSPKRLAYGVYISQLVRISSDYSSFASRHYKLTERLIHQGFRYSDLCKAFHTFARRHGQILNKYNYSVRRHFEDGICLPSMYSFISRHVSCR